MKGVSVVSENKSLLVVGSSNIDYVMNVASLPQKGETVMGLDIETFWGGKGANQAVAASRIGTDVCFATYLGTDQIGSDYVKYLSGLNIALSVPSAQLDAKTGTAWILVDSSGENMITVFPGANQLLAEQDLLPILEAKATPAGILMQLEIPVSVASSCIRKANERNIPVFLNPSPVNADFSLQGLKVDYLIVNHIEAEILSGIRWDSSHSAGRISESLHESGAENVIITSG